MLRNVRNEGNDSVRVLTPRKVVDCGVFSKVVNWSNMRHLIQVFSDHGCFRQYLHQFGHAGFECRFRRICETRFVLVHLLFHSA